MKLYRIERHGLGPFRQFHDHRVDEFSITCEDVIFKREDDKKKFYYACDSHKKLEAYFGEKTLSQLLKVGYEIQEYIVPDKDVRQSPNKKQYAFYHAANDIQMPSMLHQI